MSIKSYIAIPQKGKKKLLNEHILTINNCETMPAENEDVIIVLTDTNSDHEDQSILDKINSFESLRHLTLVAGYETNTENLT